MKRQAKAVRINVFILCIVALSFLTPLSSIHAQQLTHRVEKGDTLWSICEKYYGDPDLWPKLWEMNPFITNPHFLTPGDIITLIDKESLKKPEKPSETAMKPTTPEKTPMKGIDISSMTKFEAIGFLFSGENFKPLGKIVSTVSSRLFLTKGDTMTVLLVNPANIGPGTRLTIAQASPRLDHPQTSKALGYVVTTRGEMVIEKDLGDSLFEAKVTASFKPISSGDLIIPFEPFSPCIEPMPTDESLRGCIAAAKDQATVIGRHSVVYLDRGLNEGFRRGNVFEVVKMRSLPDPNFKPETLTDYLDRRQIPLPYKRIGLVLVLESRQQSSTALVLSASESLPLGAEIKGFSWTEKPEILSRIPACALE